MPAQPFHNVVVVGGSGTLGVPLVAALLASQRFKVSVLCRASSSATFPPGVAVKRVKDFTCYQELTSALQDQDAVVCALTDSVADVQKYLIEAAVDAGVKRFIPSEFANSGLSLPIPEMEQVMASRASIIELLGKKVEMAAASGLEFHWTAINNGLFFDWGLQAEFLDVALPPRKAATLWMDAADACFSVTNVSTVTLAVVNILTHGEAEFNTRDRFVQIESFKASQNLVIAALEHATREKWRITTTTTDDQFRLAREEMNKGERVSAYYRWIRGAVFSGQRGCRYETSQLDNKLLGLPDESLSVTVKNLCHNAI